MNGNQMKTSNTWHPLRLLALVLLPWAFAPAAQAQDLQAVADSLQTALAADRTPSDSIATLLRITDVTIKLKRLKALEQVYDIALREAT